MIEVVSYRRPGPAERPRIVPPAAGPVRPLPPARQVPPAPTARTAPPPADGGTGRLAWADTAKGICIILVVMMHTTLSVGEEMGGTGFLHPVVAFAKPFRIPDFFLVSGLFLARVIDRDWRSYLDKRLVHFAYFYLLWLVIQSVLKAPIVSGGTPAGFVHHLVASLIEPFSTLWFIYLLAVFSVVTKLLRRVPPAALLACAAALQVLPIDSGSGLVDEFCARWVYFLVGYLFAPFILRLAERASQRVTAALAGLALWAAVNGAAALTTFGPAGRFTIAELPAISLVLGLAGALAIVVVAALLARAGLAAPLRYCGQHSIAIYLTFFLPMAAARFVVVRTGIIGDVGTAAAVVTVFAVAASLILERSSRGTRFAFLYRRPTWAHLPAARPRLRLQPAE